MTERPEVTPEAYQALEQRLTEAQELLRALTRSPADPPASTEPGGPPPLLREAQRTLLELVDGTARVAAETARREAEARFRQIVETSIQGIWTLDLEARTTYVNEPLARMLGYAREEMLGQSLYAFIPDSARTLAEGQFRERMSGKTSSSEFTFLHKSGRLGQVFLNLS